jgi:xanthine dehydrogenase FAD-binding subunit
LSLSIQPIEPAAIDVRRPHTLEQLLGLIAETEAPHYFLAGGTDLLVQHKDGVIPSSTWLDITGLKELQGIRLENGEVWLGGLASHEEMARSPIVQKYAPALVEGCAVIGGPQIRWRGTVGGNLANASPAADTVPPLYTLDAQVDLLGVDGSRRTVPVDELAHAPRKTLLGEGELIVSVRFPAREGMRGSFLRLGQRQAQAISKVSVAVSAIMNGDKFHYVSIACGSVAPTVIRAPKAEAALREGGFNGEAIEEACRLIQEEVRPIDDGRSNKVYRKAMSGVLLRRALGKLRSI